MFKEKIKQGQRELDRWIAFHSMAYRTGSQTSIGDTSFSLVYGFEAMLLIELDIASHRWYYYNTRYNVELREKLLDLLPELLYQAALRTSKYIKKMTDTTTRGFGLENLKMETSSSER